jgi:hypothetical protein
MHRDSLSNLVHRKPFKPFRVTVSSGDDFEIKHPEAAILGEHVMAVSRVLADQEELPNLEIEMVWIDYDNICYCQGLPKREAPF